MINDKEVAALVSKLDINWFNEKKKFFKEEGLYNNKSGKILAELPQQLDEIDKNGDFVTSEIYIHVDVELKQYAWSIHFPGSIADSLDLDNTAFHVPLDSSEVADNIIAIIEGKVAGYLDLNVIDGTIKSITDALTTEVNKMKKNTTDSNYAEILDYFLYKSLIKISEKFLIIEEQIELKKSFSYSIDRLMSPQICSKIANFKLGNRKFVTSVVPVEEPGIALYNFFFKASNEKIKSKIYLEDWAKHDTYYLISRLFELFSQMPKIAELEEKLTLVFKKADFFVGNNYSKFLSSPDLEKYKLRHHNKVLSIEEQLNSLF